MILSFTNIRKVLRQVLKTSGYALGLPRDLANVNEWKTMFDPYIVVSRLWGAATFSRDFTTNLTPHCRVFSGAVKTEKLNTPLWPGPRECGYKSQVH